MSKHPNDDLFASTTMTFGEHIEELRKALFKSLAWLFVGVAVGIMVATHVVGFIQTPLKQALTDYYQEKARLDLNTKYNNNVPPEVLAMVEDRGMVPDLIRVEPFGILERLKQDYPQQFVGIEISQHQFAPDDVRPENVARLAAKIVAEGESEKNDPPPPGKAIFSALSSQQQAELKQLAELDEPDSSDSRELILMFNDILGKRSIYTSAAMASADFVSTMRNDVRRTIAQSRKRSAEDIDTDELRRLNRLLIASAYPKLIRRPHLNVLAIRTWKPKEVRVQSLTAHEVFMIWLKAAVVTGLVVVSPMIFWHIWSFVAAGLYPHEKKYMYIFLPFSILLFLAGAGLAFFFVFKPVLSFLFSFNRSMNIDPDPRISEWLSFVLFLPIGFGISFQLPLVMLFLERIGIFTVQSYLSKWRIAMLVIFVLAMLLTPADPVSMLMMAVPLTILYFGGIGMCRWLPKIRSPYDLPDEV